MQICIIAIIPVCLIQNKDSATHSQWFKINSNSYYINNKLLKDKLIAVIHLLWSHLLKFKIIMYRDNNHIIKEANNLLTISSIRISTLMLLLMHSSISKIKWCKSKVLRVHYIINKLIFKKAWILKHWDMDSFLILKTNNLSKILGS